MKILKFILWFIYIPIEGVVNLFRKLAIESSEDKIMFTHFFIWSMLYPIAMACVVYKYPAVNGSECMVDIMAIGVATALIVLTPVGVVIAIAVCVTIPCLVITAIATWVKRAWQHSQCDRPCSIARSCEFCSHYKENKEDD